MKRVGFDEGDELEGVFVDGKVIDSLGDGVRS
jgi:hypothetical protein